MEWGGWRVQAALMALLALLLPAWTVPLLVMDNAHHGCCEAEFRCSACGAGFCHSRASPQAGLASAFAASFRSVRRVWPQDLGSCHLVSRLRLRLRVGRACRRVNVAMAASGKSATAHDGDGGSRKKVRSPLTGRQIYVGGSAFQNVIDLGYIFVNGELVHRNCVEQGPNGESIILGETAPSLAPACKRGAGAEPYPHTNWRAWCVQVICRPRGTPRSERARRKTPQSAPRDWGARGGKVRSPQPPRREEHAGAGGVRIQASNCRRRQRVRTHRRTRPRICCKPRTPQGGGKSPKNTCRQTTPPRRLGARLMSLPRGALTAARKETGNRRARRINRSGFGGVMSSCRQCSTTSRTTKARSA